MEGMAQRSTRRDQENQITTMRLNRARPVDMDLIRELPYGPAACHGRIFEAGNTSAPDHALSQPSKYFLHRRGRPNTFVTLRASGRKSPKGDAWTLHQRRRVLIDPREPGKSGARHNERARRDR